MIEVNHLNKSFGTVRALDDVSFRVQTGKILGFLGSNGAGKTTTMEIMCGALGADSGSVLLSGIDINKDPIAAKKLIGYLPDEPPLHHDMSVESYLEYVGKLKGLKGGNLKKSVESSIDKLALSAVIHRKIGNLSKGFKQRVGLAQAIIHDPPILVLDEPTEGLDPNQIYEIRDLIKSLKGNHTIVLSSHILSEVENTCDEIAIIDKGSILIQASSSQLKNASSDQAIYRLTLDKPSDEFLKDLLERQLVISADIDINRNDRCSILMKPRLNENAQNQILLAAIQHQYVVKEYRQEISSLEDVFMKFTSHKSDEVRL